MKYLAWSGIALALVGIVQSLFLAVSWLDQGYGLHPAICGVLAGFLAFGGWWMAGWAERLEADEQGEEA